MYRDFEKDKLSYLKGLVESAVNMDDMNAGSNPVKDIYNWDGKGELPTTIKFDGIDEIAKKIAAKSDGDLSKTEFNEMFEKIFGDGVKKEYSPYDSLEDFSYRDNLIEGEKKNTKIMNFIKEALEEKNEEEKEDDENEKKISEELDNLKKSEISDDEESDDDDEDNSLKEMFNTFSLDDESLEKELEQVSETTVDEKSPISLLEDSDEDLINLNTLLEQTQLIEDEVDSILGYDELNEDVSDFSDVLTENDEISLDEYDDMLMESDEQLDDVDMSEYFDEDVL